MCMGFRLVLDVLDNFPHFAFSFSSIHMGLEQNYFTYDMDVSPLIEGR